MARPLTIGDPIPEFEAIALDGRTLSNADLAGKTFVLYFYPKDETPGCTAQACSYRNHHEEYEALGVPVYGVSRDDAESHKAFAANHRLPFQLLADVDGAMHDRFGATHFGGLPRRISYLIDANGRVAASYDSHLRPADHASRLLDAARQLAS